METTNNPLTPQQSHYVLGRLRETGKVRQRDIESALSNVPREISQIEGRLRALRGDDTAEPATLTAPARRGRPPGAQNKPEDGRKRKPTKRQLASRAIQGRYMGLLRQFTGEQRATFERLREQSGREASIAAMTEAKRTGNGDATTTSQS